MMRESGHFGLADRIGLIAGSIAIFMQGGMSRGEAYRSHGTVVTHIRICLRLDWTALQATRTSPREPKRWGVP